MAGLTLYNYLNKMTSVYKNSKLLTCAKKSLCFTQVCKYTLAYAQMNLCQGTLNINYTNKVSINHIMQK